MARKKLLGLAVLAVLPLGASLGCEGQILDQNARRNGGGVDNGSGTNTDPSAPGGTGNSSTQKPGPNGIVPPVGSPMNPPPAGDPTAAGPMPLRRLTVREYNNTVRDLLGDTTKPADAFPADHDSEFLFHRSGIVSTQDLSSVKDAAAAVAGSVAGKAMTLAPCAMGTAEDACAKSFVTDFGLRAYRRPLVQEEVDRLMGLYTAGRTTLMLDYPGAIQLLVEGMLQSPAFLYHWELGYDAPTVEGKLVRLNPYEAASRLSYFVWGSMPDADLFKAAADNQLGSAAELQAQTKRMLADPKARDTVISFTEEWLNLDQILTRPKDPMFYPEYNDALKNAMAAEVKAFVGGVVFDGDGKFGSILTSTSTFVDQALGGLYGVQGAAGGKQAMLDASQRSGLFTRAGFLSVNAGTDASSPTKRGRRVYERLLCGVLPTPPNNVPPPKPASAAGTTRQHAEEHDKNPCATACHTIMDPVGFAFEHYDGIGKYRTQEKMLNIDSTGSIDLDGSHRDFKDARELSQLLAASPTVARCFATQWLRYAFKRTETDADQASINDIVAAFGKGNSVADLIVSVVGSRSFRYRTPGSGEKLQ
jgi:hypothetical protein